MANIKPRKFLCLGGPLDHQYKTWGEVQKHHFYYQYNSSGGCPLTAVLFGCRQERYYNRFRARGSTVRAADS